MPKKTHSVKSKMVPVHFAPDMETKIEETLRLVRALSESTAAGGAHARRIRTRVQKCTQENFHLLPGLVQRAEFIDWTGISDKDLSAEVKEGRIRVHRSSPTGYALYYKTEIARLTGFKL